MRILVCHNFYQQKGGEDVVVRQEIDLLVKNGNIVELFSADSTIVQNFSFIQKFLFFFRTVFNFHSYNSLTNRITDFKPDVVHIHNVFPILSPSVYYACFKNNIPIVQTIHNLRFLCPNGLFYTHNSVCERCKFGNYFHAVDLKAVKIILKFGIVAELTKIRLIDELCKMKQRITNQINS